MRQHNSSPTATLEHMTIAALTERTRIAWMRLWGRARPTDGGLRTLTATEGERALGGMGLLPGHALTSMILEELESMALLVRDESVWVVNDGPNAESASLFAEILAEQTSSEATLEPLPTR